MNIKILLFLNVFITIMLFQACGNKKDMHKGNIVIAGRYINNTVLNKISDTIILGNIPHYCYEINFIGADSVDINNGFEEYKLFYKKDSNNHYLLQKASYKGDMFFTISGDSTFILKDSAWNNIPTNTEFKRVPDNRAEKWVFDYYLNAKAIAGKYRIYKNNKPTQQYVIFKADGNVIGLKDYNTYNLCYAGDCLGETRIESNVISLSGNNTKSETTCEYAYKMDRRNGILCIYALAAPIKDIEGEREIIGKVFDLRQ